MIGHTCYGCDSHPCEVYKRAMEEAEDETDVYLIEHSCKVGCPNGWDKEQPCYPTEEMLKAVLVKSIEEGEM